MKAIFFCGHKSRYGLAHLKPILSEFDVSAVVLADDKRWQHFLNTVTGSAARAPQRSRILGRLATRTWFNTASGPDPSSEFRALVNADIPILEAHSVNELAWLKGMEQFADHVFLCAAYPQIFGQRVLSLSTTSPINFHPSALPRCRGAHPHFWSLASGEALGGVTAHYMTAQLDAGDIVAQKLFSLEGYYYSQLYDRIVAETPLLVAKVRAFLEDSPRSARSQDNEKATYFKNDRDIHHRIFWQTMTVQQVYNLIRTEMAFCFLGRTRITPTRSTVLTSNKNLTNGVLVEPGTIVDVDRDRLVIKAVDGLLEIGAVDQQECSIPLKAWIGHTYPAVGEKLL